jgi:hypothetical protein
MSERDQVVLNGIKAAERLDTFNDMLGECDKLIAPMRKIMEGKS